MNFTIVASCLSIGVVHDEDAVLCWSVRMNLKEFHDEVHGLWRSSDGGLICNG